MPTPTVYAVALPTPLRRTYDYLAPSQETSRTKDIGARVEVSFGSQTLIGIVVDIKNHSDCPIEKLKPVIAVLDEEQPLLSQEIIDLTRWASNYYHHPIGDVINHALPTLLRQGDTAQLASEPAWRVTPSGQDTPLSQLKRAPKQAAALELIKQKPFWWHRQLRLQNVNSTTLKALTDKQLIEPFEVMPNTDHDTKLLRGAALKLNQEQQQALDQIRCNEFTCYLLYGTTGSGKTEVYLQTLEKVLARGQQALILIPEIGLTPQTLRRFQERFNRPLTVLHSGLNNRERKQAWLLAALGKADIIIGTRSAIFTPIPRLGIIIMDEEHDLSFKQQEGFRYSTRDIAAVRSQKLKIPLMLGTATPALETLHNADTKRYQTLLLQQRAGAAVPPEINFIDVRGEHLQDGLCDELIRAIDTQLQAGNQVLVFINRRGFAPTLMCHDCGWIAQCHHCDARLTVHKSPSHLHCHHCDFQMAIHPQCPSCNSHQLHNLGQGTERTEQYLTQRFEHTPVIRVDRDSTRLKNAMQNILSEVNKGEPCILVGTQMLAKGHHFPNVTLVAVIDADSGLFSTDFRGPERMGQLLIQVSGRAGRAEKTGQVLIQTHLSDHPLLQTLKEEGYNAFARLLLQERKLSQMPPYRFMILLRAESQFANQALQLLQYARHAAEHIQPPSPQLGYLGPMPAPMEKRNQRYRFQLQISANSRGQLHQILHQLIPQLEAHTMSRRVRWSVDVDPLDMH